MSRVPWRAVLLLATPLTIFATHPPRFRPLLPIACVASRSASVPLGLVCLLSCWGDIAPRSRGLAPYASADVPTLRAWNFIWLTHPTDALRILQHVWGHVTAGLLGFDLQHPSSPALGHKGWLYDTRFVGVLGCQPSPQRLSHPSIIGNIVTVLKHGMARVASLSGRRLLAGPLTTTGLIT